MEDPYLEGHFPGFAIFPGVFLVEALRQAVAVALVAMGYPPAVITALKSVRFTAPLRPGHRFTLEAASDPVDTGEPFAVEANFVRSDGVRAARMAVTFQWSVPNGG